MALINFTLPAGSGIRPEGFTTLNTLFKICFPLILAVIFLHGGHISVHAHAVVAGFSEVSGIEVTAAYDNGQPMSGGQVIVYAPDNPARPWLASTLDEQGRFAFVPDYAVPGSWSIQVRQAGHGAMIHIPVDAAGLEKSVAGSPQVFTGLQLTLMIACVVWGFIGTALFFSRRKT